MIRNSNSRSRLTPLAIYLSISFLFLACKRDDCAELPASNMDQFHVYLTFQSENTTKNITVNYHHTQRKFEASQVFYDTESRGGIPSSYRMFAGGSSKQVCKQGRLVHRVQLTDLKPNTTYYFVAGDREGGFTEEKKFTTLPGGNAPLRFVTGGDMGTDEHMVNLLRLAGLRDPDFAMVGGDIAYADGKPKKVNRWDLWLKAWQENMVKTDGSMIPLLLAIGNHEVDGLISDVAKIPFFFNFFAQNGDTAYFTRLFGDHTVVHVLDSGHTINHGGRQAKWLEGALKKHAKVPNRLAIYHAPLYPTHRSLSGPWAVNGRRNWGPLFDKYKLTAAFENHDHTMKRTHPLKAKEIMPEGQGTVYFGDGCWGKKPRSAKKRWYVAKTASKRHFWMVDIDSKGLRARAVDDKNKIIDDYSIIRESSTKPALAKLKR